MIPAHASMPIDDVDRALGKDRHTLEWERKWGKGTTESPHSCNLHSNCAEAQAKATAKGRGFIDHCHDEDCEDCFGK